MVDPERRIDVFWDGEKGTKYDITLSVNVEDRKGILADITSIIADTNTDIRTVEAQSFEDQKGAIDATVSISNVKELEPDAGRQSRALGDEPPCAVHVVSDGATMNPIDRVEKWNFVGVVAAEVSEPWGAGALVEHCTYWGLYFRRYHLFDT